MKPALTYEEAFIRDMHLALERRRQSAIRNPKSAMGSSRMYSGAQTSRLTSGWATSQTSADAEIRTSLRPLRQRCRALIRDAGFAKRAKTLVVNNVIGSGIGMQAQVMSSRGNLNERINADIEAAWEEWSEAKNCHTGGRLSFPAMEQFCMGQVFEAGEVFIRKHYRPFGNSRIPYALEVIEPERVIDEFQPSPLDPSANIRMGVECDSYHRPIAYWIRTVHPGESYLSQREQDMIERVPADQIIHLAIIDRWPQTRGVPWMHTAARKLNDMDGYSEAEIIRARDQANVSRALKTDRPYGTEITDSNGNVTRELVSEPGMTEVLYADEEMQYPAPTSPNSSGESFLRFLLREIAAGTGPSYGDLSRDRSQGTYSSERQDLLTDRDLWRVFQSWFIREYRLQVHRDFIQQGTFSRAISSIPIEQYAMDPRKFEKARYKPRGWSWIDPSKETGAAKGGITGGLTTLTDVIAKTADGRDIEDILEERAQELALKKKIELKYDVKLDFDTDPEFVKQGLGSGAKGPGLIDSDEEQGGGDDPDSVNFDNLKQKMDAYGVGVRAGAITPQVDDEDRFRKESGLPDMSREVKSAWKKDGNVRRPITLQSADGTRPAPGQPAKDPGQPLEE